MSGLKSGGKFPVGTQIAVNEALLAPNRAKTPKAAQMRSQNTIANRDRNTILSNDQLRNNFMSPKNSENH